jgi:mannose-1-phosphate guanylyltransferase/mannose-6-phosphate isomerase
MPYSLVPIILAGGSGTRLWPLSRKNFPKQFLCLQSEQSLLQQTMQRVQTLNAKQVLVVSNDAHYFLCQEQLQAAECNLQYVLEPCARNTAPAIATAAFHLSKTIGRDTVMLILPSDHWIGQQELWQEAMLAGAQLAAEEDLIVTFGIKPDSAKTGYGYIEAGSPLTDSAYRIARFREKPDEATAKVMLEQGNYFWNSGMFVCRAGVYLDELQRLAGDIAIDSQKALQNAYHHHDFIRLDAEAFSQCRSESVDYAIMENTDKAAVIPVDMAWSDLGCWTAVADANNVDEQGNALSGNVVAQDSFNCLIRSEHTLVTTMGIHDQIIVATADAVLVADKRYSQQVKDLVNSISKQHSQLVDDHLRVARPWGYYEILAEGPSFKVKRLMVKPGAKLSLQMHKHRAEHWVIVEGKAEIVNGDDLIYLTVNQSTYIPKETRHRLSNPYAFPLYVIEVQSGDYLGEDDIQRFDDIYTRKIAVEV